MIKTRGKSNWILSIRDTDVGLDTYFMSISKESADERGSEQETHSKALSGQS